MNKLTVTVKGEQGSGKTHVARLIAGMLRDHGVRVTLRDAEDVEVFQPPRESVCEALIETRQG